METLNNLKEYISTGSGTAGTLLIPTKIYATLIEEVDKALIPRNYAALYLGPGEIPGSSVSLNFNTPNTLKIDVIGEGAEIPMDALAQTSLTITPLKYGKGIRITKEMMEDCQFSLLQQNIKALGKRFAENETKLIITALDGAGTTQSGGAAIVLSDITAALLGLENNDYIGRTMLVGNEVANDMRLIDTFAESDKYGSREMMDRGFIGRIYGADVFRFSTLAAPSTTYAKYAYIFDNEQAYVIVEKRPVSIENIKLPLYDMEGAIATQRIAVSLLRAFAVAKITTS